MPTTTRSRSQVVLLRTLLRAHARIVDELKKVVTDECGLSMPEFDMIAELGRRDGLTMSDLAERMITSPSSVTRIAKALEKKGLVLRARSEHSDRVVIASLTEAGIAFFEAHFGGVVSRTSELIDDALDEGEQVRLAALLDKLAV